MMMSNFLIYKALVYMHSAYHGPPPTSVRSTSSWQEVAFYIFIISDLHYCYLFLLHVISFLYILVVV